MQTAHRRFAAAFAAVLLAVVCLPANTAAADDKLPLGGGAGIVVNGDTMCTLTTIGHDKNGDLIGFTSAHCGGPGAQIAAEGAENAGPVGIMVAGNDGLDYAVIKFDPAKVTPVASSTGLRSTALARTRRSARSPASRAAPPVTRAGLPGGQGRVRAPL